MNSRLPVRAILLCLLLALPLSGAIAADAQREWKDVAYVEGEGVRGQQRLDIFLPANAGPHPLIVYVHGGAWRGGGTRGHRGE